MEPAEPDEAAYATKVEEAFIAERGTPFLLSPKDWTLIRTWREAGIPLDTVIRAVREVFEKRRARGQAGKISSIAYCADAVEELWEMERRGLVGKAAPAAGAPPGAPAKDELLASLVAGLRAASERLADGKGEKTGDFLRRVSGAGAAADADAATRAAAAPSTFEEIRKFRDPLFAAASKIEALPPDLSLEQSESELSAIEASLVRSALRRLSPEQKALVESRVAEALGDVTGVSAHVVERMRKALTRREVRALLGLPRLTLLHG